MPKKEDISQLIKEFRKEINTKLDVHTLKLDAHTVDIHDLKESVMGALNGVKPSLDRLTPLEKIPERTATLEREVGAIKTALKNISAAK
jgi:hypothetical protein